ncbi:MAG: hypothetical protein GQ558_00065, partial [Thermoplasmata archaeon]|nr:hypothetical protein [Thermoplasmata archaeon]
MNSKPKISIIFFATAMMVLMVFSSISVGCGDPPPTPEEQVRCEYNLIAGQDFDTPAGTVIIQEMYVGTSHQIWVTFQTNDDWFLDESHVHIAWLKDGALGNEWSDYDWGKAITSKGSPRPGKFDYSKDHGS